MITKSLHNIDADIRLAREAARTISGELSLREPEHA
jgi:hypothetical protein